MSKAKKLTVKETKGKKGGKPTVYNPIKKGSVA